MTLPQDRNGRKSARPDKGAGPTAGRILDVAQDMVQQRGYHDFSFRDIADVLGIKSASIHYHFASKTDLGRALVERYRRAFLEELAAVEARHATAPRRLKSFVALFRRTLSDDRLCLCAMLGAERGGLPQEVNAEVQGFFADSATWLVAVLKQGRAAGEIDFLGTPQAMADHILGLMEGAMVLARSLDDLSRFDRATAALLRILQPVSPPPRSRS